MQKDMEPLECRWKGLGHRLAYFPVMLVLLFKQPYLFNENGWFKLTQCIFDPIVFFCFLRWFSAEKFFFQQRHSHYLRLAMHSNLVEKKSIFHTCGNVHDWTCYSIHRVFFSQVYFFHYLFKSAGKKTMQLHSTQVFRLHHNPVGIGNGHWDR